MNTSKCAIILSSIALAKYDTAPTLFSFIVPPALNPHNFHSRPVEYFVSYQAIYYFPV